MEKTEPKLGLEAVDSETGRKRKVYIPRRYTERRKFICQVREEITHVGRGLAISKETEV